MQLSPPRALLLFLLLALIKGPALAGKGQIAGGGIECNQNMARFLELDERLRRGSDAPPCRAQQALARRLLLA
ncbi:hypothetical protein ACOAPY_02105 [Pseudomonas sp. P3C3]